MSRDHCTKRRLTPDGTAIIAIIAITAVLVPAWTRGQEAVDGGWLDRVNEEIRQQEYEFSHTPDGDLSAPNRAQDLRTRVDGRGLQVVSRTRGADAFDVKMSLTGVGREGGRLQALEDGQLYADAGRVDIFRAGITEWLVNDERGVEHGFVLDSPPEGRGPEVVLALALDGTLVAYPLGDRGVMLKDAAGNDVLRYDGLKVWDATGRELPARMAIATGEIRILFQDGDAVYPVTVDPVLSGPTWTINGVLFSGLGGSVSTAGDVNNDGYSDILIGWPLFDGGSDDEGLASLYLGSAGGPSTTAAWSYQPNQTGAKLGTAVSTAGDVNNDGYDDVVVAAPGAFSGHAREGRAWVFLGSSGGLSSTPHRTLEPDVAFAAFGSDVDFAGDVNNDGYHDIIIGAPKHPTTATEGGKIFLFMGSSSGMSSTAAFTAESQQNRANFGSSVAGAGDVNGDGFSDLVVGARLYDSGQVDEGKVWRIHGSSTTPSVVASFDRGSSNTTGIHFGEQVAGAGDVNGDGYADVIVGATGASAGAGSTTLLWGSASGVTGLGPIYGEGPAVGTAGDINGDGLADFLAGDPDSNQVRVYCGVRLSNPSACQTLTFSVSGSSFGAAVDTAGDVNGDGYSDVLVGAPTYSINSFVYGRASLYLGNPDGLVTIPDNTLGGDLGRLGEAVAAAGDVNGDGFSDVIVGEPEFDGGQVNEGRVLAFHGSRDGLATSPNRVIEGNFAGAAFGAALAGAGDVNGDGYDDIIIGAPEWSQSLANQGRAFIVLGSSAGLGSGPVTFMGGPSANSFFGIAVSPAGDFNGDGYADVAIGAPGHANGQAGEGRVRVYEGSPTGIDLTTAVFLEANVANAELGRAVGTADVDGDGFSDIIVGAPGDAGGAGAVRVFRGSFTGIATVSAATVTGVSAGERMGAAVAGAGDVNGDGRDEVIAGSPEYSGGQTDEGRISLFAGGFGAQLSLLGRRESNLTSRFLGTSVGSAGDVNGDGYADVIAGAPGGFTGTQHLVGVAQVWYGGPSGIPASFSWQTSAGLFGSGGRYGFSVAGAGDVDGDGFDEVIVGAPDAFPSVNDASGGYALFLGGGGHGLDRIPRQQQPFSTSNPPVARLGMSGDNDSVRLRSRARTAAGRDRVQVVYEVKPLGQPLNGSGLVFSNELKSSSPVSDGSRTNFSSRINGLTQGPAYHWRLRFRSPNPRFPRTRWMGSAGIAPSQKGFATSCNVTVWSKDQDGDGYGNSVNLIEICNQPSGYAALGGDCNDFDPNVNPGVSEVGCDGIDNDCSPGTADAADTDGDGVDVCDPGAPGDLDGLSLDCNDGDSDAWSLPGGPQQLALARSGGVTSLVWLQPGELGGTTGGQFGYETIRTSVLGDFFAQLTSNLQCIASGPSATSEDLLDPGPGGVFYYLIGAENSCGGGTLGTSTAGVDRNGSVCPN